VRFDAEATGVREARFDRVTLAIRPRDRQPRATRLRAAGARRAAAAGWSRRGDDRGARYGRAGGRQRDAWSQEVVVNPVALGVALATQLQTLASGGAAAVDAVVVGRWELDFGVLGRWTSEPGDLVVGRVD
jgi:hypothetical protein